MITIWKYELDEAFETTPPGPGLVEFEIPAGARPLHVDYDPSLYEDTRAVRVWMEVNTTAPKVLMTFKIVGTGHELPDGFMGKYIGTAVIHPYAWHVYQLPTRELPSGKAGT